MYRYSISQWFLFFFCYAFIGWIRECFFVSFKQFWKNKKWKFTNRGFLHGPVIPIYGFAAVSILAVTSRIDENTAAVFAVGAVTATLFELVTGITMEHLFKVKYWDYSGLPLNYQGHICVFVSIFWGVFSILLVQVVHIPIGQSLMKCPQAVCELLAFLLSIGFTYDATISFNEAVELREILENLSENSETIKRLERRFDAIVAFTPVPDLDDIRHLKLSVRENTTYYIERMHWMNEKHINRIKEYVQLPEFDELPDRDDLLEMLEKQRIKIRNKSNKQYLQAMNQLKRNPTVKSKSHQEFIEMLNEWLNNPE